jgi:ABC-type multidrug transport system fused ATPase/permease subunit
MKFRPGFLPTTAIIVGIALASGVGFLDYVTGDIGFSIFYLIPIVFVSWYAGLRWGLVTSALSAVLWLLDDISVSTTYSHPLIPYWNMVVRLGFYVLIVFLFVRLKNELERRKELIAQLQEANRNIRTLRGLLPICAWCKKIRDDQGYWKQLEHYMEEQSEATFTHGICPECYKQITEGEPEEKP